MVDLVQVRCHVHVSIKNAPAKAEAELTVSDTATILSCDMSLCQVFAMRTPRFMGGKSSKQQMVRRRPESAQDVVRNVASVMVVSPGARPPALSQITKGLVATRVP